MFFLSRSVEIKPKFCINCKYFIKNSLSDKSEYGKCTKFPFEQSKFLIDGVIRNDDFAYCSTARSHDDLCGAEAKEYKRKYKRK
jgi:hypothetical protein